MYVPYICKCKLIFQHETKIHLLANDCRNILVTIYLQCITCVLIVYVFVWYIL